MRKNPAEVKSKVPDSDFFIVVNRIVHFVKSERFFEVKLQVK